MKKSDIGSLIQKSLDRTIFTLFKPFRFKKWLFLTVIALLAGAIGFGGGGGGGNWPGSREEKKAQAAVVQPQKIEVSTKSSPSLTVPTPAVSVSPDAKKNYSNFPDWRHWPAWAFVLMGVGVILLLGIMIAYSWLWARFQFIWFHALVQNDASVAKPFAQYAKPAQSLFNFSLVTLFGFWGLFAGFIYWIYQIIAALKFFQDKTIPWVVYIQSFIGPVVIFILFFVATIIFWTYAQHFVVTIMALEGCGFIQGWKKFGELLQKNRKDLLLYLLVTLGLGILCGIIQMIVGLIWMFALFIVGGIIFGGFYLILVMLLKMQAFFTITTVILGVPAFLAVMGASWMMSLPFAVFFRNFSLYYMSALDGPYAPLPLEETAP